MPTSKPACTVCDLPASMPSRYPACRTCMGSPNTCAQNFQPQPSVTVLASLCLPSNVHVAESGCRWRTHIPVALLARRPLSVQLRVLLATTPLACGIVTALQVRVHDVQWRVCSAVAARVHFVAAVRNTAGAAGQRVDKASCAAETSLAKWPQVLAHTCESRASGTLAKLAIGGEQLCRAMHMQLPQFDCIQFGRDRLSWQNEPISACSLTN